MQTDKNRQLTLTTIGRPVDFSYPTNRAIAILTIGLMIAGTAIALIQDAAWGRALTSGFAWGAAAFLAWALCRETDRDRWFSAFIAVAFAVTSTALFGHPKFLLLFWFLLALRVVNRSTGNPPGILDFVAFYGIKLWLGFSLHWTIPLLTLPTMLFADLQRFSLPVRIGLPLILPLSALVLGFVRGWHIVAPQWGWIELLVMIAVILALIPVIVSYRRVRSVCDQAGKPLLPHRIQWALAWIAAATVLLTLTGTATLQDLGPVWGAMIGTTLGWAAQRTFGIPMMLDG